MKKKSSLEWKKYFESEQFEKKYTYTGKDLGYTLKEKETIFKIWAPTAQNVILNLYKGGDPRVNDKTEEIVMQETENGVWCTCIKRNLKNVYYTYTVIVEGEAQETQDPYSRACGVNGKRSMVADLNETDPEGWQKDIYLYDAEQLPVIYELHIKDFSYSKSSGISEKHRGKYKAFLEDNTTLYGEGKKRTGISYLKELGITHVHLLPCFDFGSVDEASANVQFNWGYDPVNYNVPEGSYATDPFDGNVRIREFKEMVMALHRAGLGVIMDVVYNHTHSLDSCFQKTVPYYYYRIEDDGTFSNGSVCGNDTASERSMFRRYMIDSVCYWAKEYHIDGFRFDLMGLHDVETMNEIRRELDKLPEGKSILMYGEPWAGASTNMKKGSVPALKKNVEFLDKRIAIFDDDTRDAVKGSVFYEKQAGFVNGEKGLKEKICSSVLAWCDNKGGYKPHDPGQILTYISAHDNWTLWDKLCYTMQESVNFKQTDAKVMQANKFAAGIIMTSLGIIFMQAGEEAGRTKNGCGNSYDSPAELNALDWERMYQFEDLIEYYKGMLAIRKIIPEYWVRDRKAVESIRFYRCEEDLIIYTIDTLDSECKYSRLWIIYSKEKEERTIMLPKAYREILADPQKVFSVPQKVNDMEVIQIKENGVSILGECR